MYAMMDDLDQDTILFQLQNLVLWARVSTEGAYE
jgi:hypothetical protein